MNIPTQNMVNISINPILLEKYDTPVPRYTSYPPATAFNSAVTSQTYTQWLRQMPQNAAISLYVHLPFCKSLCWYCGCFTKISQSADRMNKYIEYLIKEIDLIHKQNQTLKLAALHLGGGTPTHMPVEGMDKLLTHINKVFPKIENAAKEAEFAVEIDPRRCTQDMVNILTKHGFNRASLGVQDTNPTVQKSINRIQSLELIQNCTAMLRKGGIKSINFDLIYGLPHQTPQTITQTIQDVTALQPDRLALFAYAHVPWMKKHQELLEEGGLPQRDDRHTLYTTATQKLLQSGFVAVGMDHFAKQDDALAQANQNLHRNFQGYTTDSTEYLLGIGASAIGQMPQGFVQNTPDIKTYQSQIENGQFPTVRGYEYEGEDAFYAAIIEDLMCRFETDIPQRCTQFNQPKSQHALILQRLKPLEQDNLIDLKTCKITATGRPFVRNICAAIDPHYKPTPNRHARAV